MAIQPLISTPMGPSFIPFPLSLSPNSSSTMALQLSLSSPLLRSQQPNSSTSTHSIIFSSDHFRRSTGPRSPIGYMFVKQKKSCFSVRSTMEMAVPVVGQVTEVDKDTFWPLVNNAGDKTVVLDMYTQWCGPCKIMAPKFEDLSEKYLDTVFLKLDCNQENKPLAKELGIRVVPTFKILKNSKVVKEVTGAKFDDLVLAIDTVRSS